MRLPRITIEYQEEESYALGKVSAPLIVGFAAHWAWVYLFMFNSGQLFYAASPDMQDVLFLVSIAFFSLTLVSYGVFLERARKLFSMGQRRSRIRLVAALMVFAAMIISVLGSIVPAAPIPFVVVSGLLCGVGSAVLLMSFAVSFSVCDLPTVAVSVAAVVPLGAVGFALAMVGEYLLPGLGGLACLAMPFVEYACLGACSKQLVDNLEFGELTIPVKTRPFALHVCLPCSAFGFVLGVVCVHAISVTMQEGITSVMLAIAASGVFAGLVLICALLTQRKSNNFAFRTMLPVVAVLIAIAVAVPGANEGVMGPFVMFGVYSLISMCVWILCSDISQRFRISAFTTFGFGWGMMSVGMMVGVALSMPGAPLASLAVDGAQFVALSFVIITLGSSLLPKNSELRQALKRGAHCPALVGGDDYSIDLLRDQSVAIAADPNVKIAPAVTPVPDGLGQVAARALEESDVKPAVEAAPAAVGNVAKSGPGVAAEMAKRPVQATQFVGPRQSDAASREKPAAGDARAFDGAIDQKTVEAIAAVRAAEKGQSEMAAAAESEEGRQHAMGRFKRKCSAVADRYLLSRKETEVMFLLAKGYKSAQIQETLFISEGTANTHMRHIYRKLDVHSQRELMDLVDAEVVPEEEF